MNKREENGDEQERERGGGGGLARVGYNEPLNSQGFGGLARASQFSYSFFIFFYSLILCSRRQIQKD